jgi:hypothetical protein
MTHPPHGKTGTKHMAQITVELELAGGTWGGGVFLQAR